MAVTVKIAVILNMMQHSLVDTQWHFRGTFCPHPQDNTSLNMEAGLPLKLQCTCSRLQSHIPENNNDQRASFSVKHEGTNCFSTPLFPPFSLSLALYPYNWFHFARLYSTDIVCWREEVMKILIMYFLDSPVTSFCLATDNLLSTSILG